MKLVRKAADAVYRNNFGAFTYAAFEAANPGKRLIANWHIDCICYQLERMVTGHSANRLVREHQKEHYRCLDRHLVDHP